MYNDPMEKLLREIKRTYKWYTGERTDGTATISDVAKFFNIPIDVERQTSYIVEQFDAKTPSITIIDTENCVQFYSEFTGRAELLNYYGPAQFVSTKAKYLKDLPTATQWNFKESLYYIGSETPIIEKLTIQQHEYRLEFEKEGVNSVRLFSNNNTKIAIRLTERTQEDEHQNYDRLLVRINSNSYNYNNRLVKSLEQRYTFAPSNIVRRGNDQDKYCYFFENNVIYGINDFKFGTDESIERISGICFENRVDNVSDYMPLGYTSDKYRYLTDESIISAMLFMGISDRKHYSFEIIKTSTEFKVKIHTRKWRELGEEDLKEDRELSIPALTNEPITSQEITYLIAQLKEQLTDGFLEAASSELTQFGQRIDIKHNLVQEDMDILNPRLYIDKPFEETTQFVLDNQEELFKAAFAQFEELTKSQGSVAPVQRTLKTTDK